MALRNFGQDENYVKILPQRSSVICSKQGIKDGKLCFSNTNDNIRGLILCKFGNEHDCQFLGILQSFDSAMHEIQCVPQLLFECLEFFHCKQVMQN